MQGSAAEMAEVTGQVQAYTVVENHEAKFLCTKEEQQVGAYDRGLIVSEYPTQNGGSGRTLEVPGVGTLTVSLDPKEPGLHAMASDSYGIQYEVIVTQQHIRDAKGDWFQSWVILGGGTHHFEIAVNKRTALEFRRLLERKVWDYPTLLFNGEGCTATGRLEPKARGFRFLIHSLAMCKTGAQAILAVKHA